MARLGDIDFEGCCGGSVGKRREENELCRRSGGIIRDVLKRKRGLRAP